MKYISFLIILSGCISQISAQQKKMTLGSGLYTIDNILISKFKIPVYKDSLKKVLYTNIIPSITNCPTCMECAEPISYYKGKLQPFSCGGANGINFICTRVTAASYEIIIDTTGTKVYASKDKGKFYSWDLYMKHRAKQGDYFEFNRQWDKTILYDKIYNLHKLPVPDKKLQVKLNLNNIDTYRFYPAQVNGYWMKLKILEDKKLIGYCWIIWRNEKQWLKGFKFRTD